MKNSLNFLLLGFLIFGSVLISAQITTRSFDATTKPIKGASATDILFFEDFNSWSDYWLPPNWATGSNYFYIDEDHGKDNTPGVTVNVFGSAGYQTAFLTTPAIFLTASIIRFQFDYRILKYDDYPDLPQVIGPNDKIEIKVSTDNGASFDLVHVINQSNHITSLNFAKARINLTGYNNTSIKVQWIVSRGAGDYHVDIDNVQVELIAACDYPYNLSASNITSNSALLNWLQEGATASWEIEIVPAGFSPTGLPTHTTDTKPYNVAGLLPATIYKFYVRNKSSASANSVWSEPMAFNTLICDPSNQCLFKVQLNDVWGDGWEGTVLGFKQAGIVVATFGTGFTNGYTFGPLFIPLCSNQMTEIVVVAEGDYTEEKGFTIYYPWGEIAASRTPGNEFSSTDILGSFLSLCTQPACPYPTNINATNITPESMQINWTENGAATHWDLVWGLPGITPATGTMVTALTQTQFLLSGLLPATTYSVYVRSHCNSTDTSPWYGPIALSTAICYDGEKCIYTVQLIDSWGDGWDGTILGFKQNGTLVATFGEGFDDGDSFGPVDIHLCNGLSTQIVVVNWSAYPDEKEFYVYDPQGIEIFHHTPQQFTPSHTFFTFTSDCGTMNVANPRIFTATAQGSSEILLNWLPNTNNDKVMVAFNTLNQFGVPVDGTSYNAGATIPGGGEVLYVGNNTSFNHTNLLENVLYHYKAWSVNSTNEYSRGFIRNARTDCGLQSVPLFEDFETVAQGSIPLCWRKIVANTGPSSNVEVGWNGYNSNASLEFYCQSSDGQENLLFISPEMAPNLNTLYINFDGSVPARKNLLFDGVIIGTMSDPSNLSTFNAMQTVMISDGWENFNFHFTNYTGQDKYIALKAVYSSFSTHYIFIDNLLIASNLTCLSPTPQTASGISSSGARIQWSPNGQEISWDLSYGTSGFNPLLQGTIISGIASTSYTLGGLTPNTPHDVYVRAVCGEGSQSNWAGPISFVTLPAISILLGDANCDGTVNVLDIITMVNYIMGQNPQPFCFNNADVNQSGSINVLDIIGVVNIIMNQK